MESSCYNRNHTALDYRESLTDTDCQHSALLHSLMMVPEIHITDENPPIFDLEWMDQCVDKVVITMAWILDFNCL